MQVAQHQQRSCPTMYVFVVIEFVSVAVTEVLAVTMKLRMIFIMTVTVTVTAVVTRTVTMAATINMRMTIITAMMVNSDINNNSGGSDSDTGAVVAYLLVQFLKLFESSVDSDTLESERAAHTVHLHPTQTTNLTK